MGARSTFLAAAAWLAVGVAGAPARAQPAAEAVFEEGLREFEAGRYAVACPRIEAAVAMTNRTAIGGMLLLAQCWEKVGRVASAWSLFREVAAMATQAGQEDRRREAEEGEARLAPRLHRVALSVPPALAELSGLRISHDGVLVPREAWGVPFPADPGQARLRLEAEGKRPRELSVTIPEGPGQTPVVLEGGLEDLPRPDPAAPPARPPADVASEGGGGLGGLGVAGLVVSGLGVAGLGIGAAVGLGAKGSYDDAVAACPELACQTATEQQAVDDARSTGDVASGVFVGGAVLAAVGVTLVVIDLATVDGAAADGASADGASADGASAGGASAGRARASARGAPALRARLGLQGLRLEGRM